MLSQIIIIILRKIFEIKTGSLTKRFVWLVKGSDLPVCLLMEL
jgi:hypothetical protein